jgi:hypothetical protein
MQYQSNLSQTRLIHHRHKAAPIFYDGFRFGRRNDSVIPKERG